MFSKLKKILSGRINTYPIVQRHQIFVDTQAIAVIGETIEQEA